LSSIRLRHALAVAIALGIVAPAAIPSTAAAAVNPPVPTKYCQTATVDYYYAGNLANGGGQAWIAYATLKATGCWTTSQTWVSGLSVTPSAGTSVNSRAGASGPTNGITNFWANLGHSYSLWMKINEQYFPYQTGNYGLYPQLRLAPGGPPVSGVGPWTVYTWCRLESGWDIAPCRATGVSVTLTTPTSAPLY
jgi:hypothetical protein